MFYMLLRQSVLGAEMINSLEGAEWDVESWSVHSIVFIYVNKKLEENSFTGNRSLINTTATEPVSPIRCVEGPFLYVFIVGRFLAVYLYIKRLQVSQYAEVKL